MRQLPPEQLGTLDDYWSLQDSYRKRVVLPSVAVLALLWMGPIFSFSVLTESIAQLTATSHWPEHIVSQGIAIQGALAGIVPLAIGKDIPKRGHDFYAVVGLLTQSIGVVTQSLSLFLLQYWLYYISVALQGIGYGSLYISILHHTMTWFPDWLGASSGLVGGALGLGSLAFTGILYGMATAVGPHWTLLIIAFFGTMFTLPLALGFDAPEKHFAEMAVRKMREYHGLEEEEEQEQEGDGEREGKVNSNVDKTNSNIRRSSQDGGNVEMSMLEDGRGGREVTREIGGSAGRLKDKVVEWGKRIKSKVKKGYEHVNESGQGDGANVEAFDGYGGNTRDYQDSAYNKDSNKGSVELSSLSERKEEKSMKATKAERDAGRGYNTHNNKAEEDKDSSSVDEIQGISENGVTDGINYQRSESNHIKEKKGDMNSIDNKVDEGEDDEDEFDEDHPSTFKDSPGNSNSNTVKIEYVSLSRRDVIKRWEFWCIALAVCTALTPGWGLSSVYTPMFRELLQANQAEVCYSTRTVNTNIVFVNDLIDNYY